ncbi:MAG: sigma-70 family RNA polymerase sigma factor [Clostridia bacterium]|nr:sigma-70 family RNA polymerase sigma factor [Clostridia bacterium]
MQNGEEIYRQYAKYVYKYLLSITGSADISEEITQETFYQAIKNINKFNGNCKISTWLCAIAKNQLAAYRRKHPDYEELESITLTAASSEDETIKNVEKTRLYVKLHSCPEPYRELLYLRLLAELSFKEIGDILGRSENWARVTFYRAKEMLKKEMEKDD